MYKYINPVLFAAIVLSPSFCMIPGRPALRAEDVILLIVIVVYFLRGLSKQILDLSIDSITRILFLMGISASLAIMTMMVLFGKPLLLRDLFILPQLLKYYLVFAVVKSTCFDEKQFTLCIYTVMIVGSVAASIGICQYYNFIGINDWLTPFYATGSRLTALEVEGWWRRAIGTAGNPNYFGYILCLVVCVITSFLLQAPKMKGKGMAWIILGIIGISAAFCLSRTTLVSLAVISISALFLQRIGCGELRHILKYLFMIIIVAALFLSFLKTPGFEHRITVEHTMKGSMRGRIRDLKMPIRDALNSAPMLIVGRGPSKIDLRTDSHNGYTWYFQRFGIIGLTLYVSLLCVSLKKGLLMYRASKLWWQKALYFSTVLVIIIWMTDEWAQNLFKLPQMMSLNMFFLGLLFAKQTPHLVCDTIQHPKQNHRIPK